VKLGSCLALA
jgi:hypothetical protein